MARLPNLPRGTQENINRIIKRNKENKMSLKDRKKHETQERLEEVKQ